MAELERGPKRTAKKVLYVLRTALTGEHLLRTGRVEPNLMNLMDEYGFADAAELVELKQSAEGVGLETGLLERWTKRLVTLDERLAEAREASCLPEVPSNEADVEAWLVELRKRWL